MPLLPIAVRELRVGARRPGTYRLRAGAPAVALLLGSGYLLFYSNFSQVGQVVFKSITSLCFLYSFLAGLVFTADCLSREKRSGTLGLMFLTRLRGYDIILGKLAGTSLNAVYGLIAVLPVLALPILLGGVTGTELAAVYLALLNTLFISLVAG